MRESGTHYVIGPDPDNDPVCWCGEDHPIEDGLTGAAKVARMNEPGYCRGRFVSRSSRGVEVSADGFTLFTSNTERFRTIRRTLAFYARGKDEERAQVGLDEIEVADQTLHEMNNRLADENLSLRNALERERTKRGIAFSFIAEECHEEYADRLAIVDGEALAGDGE